MDYVIIGNGIISLSTAFRLLQRLPDNDSITLIGPSARPGSATLAAAAMLNSFGEIDAYSLQSEPDQYLFELSHRATRMWPEFEGELIQAAAEQLPSACGQCEVTQGGCFGQGTYLINNACADELDDRNFDAIVNALRDFNEPFDWVNPRDIPNYHPAQHQRATRAILIHNEGWINPRIEVEKLDRILLSHPQVTYIDQRVTRLNRSQTRIESVTLNDGQVIDGDKFLLANGASVNALLVQSDLDLNVQPVFYGIGISLEIQSPLHPHKNCIRTPNRGGACGIYSVPYFQGPGSENDHVLIGASNVLRPQPTHHGRLISIEHLMRSAVEEINGHFYNAELLNINVGWRPSTQDTYPILGKTSLDNFYIASGTKRNGFHLSPVLSEILVDLLMDEDIDPRFHQFAPERKVIHDLSREDAVEIIVSSLMSEQYQHNYRPSNIRMNEQVRQTYQDDIERLHDKVGAKDWGIPAELVNMYRYGHAQ
ncbi:MAG: FAD-dependent oxidoreductase [Gammaproteobacteria bacterium]|nr:MAG: FAD-dependent oxidoreductase [Gammaproteobacteria bacterium]